MSNPAASASAFTPASLTEGQKIAGLGALKAVATAHGEFTEEERSAIEAIAGLLGVRADLDQLPETPPDAIADVLPDPAWRERLVQAAIVVAVMDGEATKDEAALIDRYAKALGVNEPRQKNLHQVIGGHMLRLRIDLVRRFPIMRQLFSETWSEEGLPGVWRLVKAFRGQAVDPALAWKHKELGLLPEGTLGREFWKHMTREHFAFPGEPGGIATRACHHDLTHVLCGYGTDPEGECQIAAFYAGYKREDPFAFIFSTLLMFQLGIKLSPIATPAKLKWHPDLVLRALQRGAGVTRDLTDHWDYFEDVALPIAEVRRKYGIAEA